MIDLLKRHAVQVLRAAGHTWEDIARRVGVSLRSAKRVGEEPLVSAERLTELRKRAGRPPVVDGFREFVAKTLRDAPEAPGGEVLRLMREKGYAGGKSAAYELIRSLRPEPARSPLVRFEGLAGEFSQHDFGEVTVTYVSGKPDKLRFFASRLKYSRFLDVVLTPDQKVESVVRSLIHGFEVFGGVPLACVFDNPRTIVLSHKKGELNPTFARVVIDFRFAVELCAPCRGNQKGSVENLVGWVKSSFFKVRKFHDREDLEKQLAEWLEEVNERRPCRATGVVPRIRLTEERRRLRPPKCRASEYALQFPVVVGPTGMVDHDGIRYAMPPKSIGIPGTLHLYPDTVRIVAGRHERSHPRFPEEGHSVWAAEDRSAMLAAVSGERGRLYAKRQQLLDLGRDMETFLTEVVHRHPLCWKGDVERLHELLCRLGPSSLLGAVRAALDERVYTAARVEEFVEVSV
ncbi:MAG: IS21 family transposase [Planctomycetia bacterium]|nr:IS21 family transposase [Planctomycetia bacterium]